MVFAKFLAVCRRGRLIPWRWLVLFALAGCTAVNPRFDPAKPHHRTDGFANLDPVAVRDGDYSWPEVLWRSLRGEFRPDAEPAGGYEAFARRWSVPVDRDLLMQRQDTPVLTWLGHATLLVQAAGLNILIDPQFSGRAGPIPWLGARRHVPPPLAVEELPPIDLMLISHNHYDHLDRPTLDRLRAAGQRPRILVPLGLKAWFDAEGFEQVEELDWWDSRELGGLTIHFTPAQHWSKRMAFDTNQSLWGGFVVERHPAGKPWRFIYTGDTGYSADFKEIRRRLGAMDYVAVPIGAYLPRDFMRTHHTNPDDALQIVLDLEAGQGIGVHWGTFGLSQENFDQPPLDLAAALQARGLESGRLQVFRQGERRAIGAAGEGTPAR